MNLSFWYRIHIIRFVCLKPVWLITTELTRFTSKQGYWLELAASPVQITGIDTDSS